MKLSRFSVQRPIFTTMVMLIVLILGGVALNRLPIDLMPKITFPTLSVITNYENAGPEEVEDLITGPIEQAVSAVPGVQEVSSTSSDGTSVVRVSFVWGTNLDEAANDLRDRLDRVLNSLPDAASRPTLRKFDLDQFPILILGITSRLDPIEVRRIVDEQIKYRLERLSGVAALDIWGGLVREIHVNVVSSKVKALGLSLGEVVDSIKKQNVSIPTGTLRKGNYELVVSTAGEYTSLDQLRDTVVTSRGGVPIQLKDIATVEAEHKRVSRIVRINGQPGIRIAVRKQSLANTVEVAQVVLKELERIDRDIPQLDIVPLLDTSDYIRRSITNVGSVAGYGGIFAVFVLLIFLGNLRSTGIIATAIPISIIATFVFIYFSGFTLNLMTLGGLAVGVGLIVDNSIVVLENIHRMRKAGKSAREAAILGSEEVTSAIIASTLTTLVIFLPLVFIRGIAGIMFKQLAYVISFALLCSLGVALMLIPMLASRLMLPPTSKGGGNVAGGFGLNVFAFTQSFFEGLDKQYKSLLRLSLKYKKTALAIILLVLVSSLGLIPFVGVEYMPASDESEVRVSVVMDVGTHLETLNRQFEQVEAIVEQSVPEKLNTVARLGSSHWRGGGSHSGRLQIALKPLSERSRSSEAVAADLRKKLVGIPGVLIRTRAGQGLFIFRLIAGSDTERIQIDVRGYDLQTAKRLSGQIKHAIENIPGITDVRLSLEAGRPEERIVVDRDRAAHMKLSVYAIAGTLQTILSGTPSGRYREGGKEYDIRVKVKDGERMSMQELLDLTVVNAQGEPVVMKNVVRVQPRTAPVQIRRKDQERVVTLSVNISGRDMGSVLSDVRGKLSGLVIPREFSLVYSGDYEAQQEAFEELMIGIFLAIVLVYMVLACLYESVRDPFIVLFSVPLAVIGVTLMLFLTDTTFNVQSYIGCIMLAGIVVNNAILLVDHINLLRRRDDLPVHEAIVEAGSRRLRPILMTASTTILGMFPLSLGLLEGGQTQASLARVVIGGLASSSIITLVVVPLLYSIVEGWFPLKRADSGAIPESVEGRIT
ncbi:MAG: efflux RND transporter permease subunit [Proteobacteria bacterium]|nr:efflux RND transporter permease subunit [Pseudomonadota bacterium]